jgi:hypothetical protein
MLKKNKFLPTILITYVLDRVKYLKRLSDYYQDYEGEVCFIGPKFDINFKVSDNISFFFTNEIDLFKKIISTKNNFNSELVVWSAEDDFVSKRFLKNATLKLTNKNIVAVDGYALRFDEKTLKISQDYYDWHHLRNLFSYGNMNGLTFEERISNMGDMFTGQPVHSVCRKDAFYEAWELASNKSLNQIKWLDKVVTLSLLTKGEIAYIPTLAHLRSNGERLLTKKFHPNIFTKSFSDIHSSKLAIMTLAQYVSKKCNISEDSGNLSVNFYLSNIDRYYRNQQVKKKRRHNILFKILKKIILKNTLLKVFFDFGFFPTDYLSIQNEVKTILSFLDKSVQD